MRMPIISSVLIHLKRDNLDAAQRYFENALRIDSRDPDYHYYLGRVFEAKGDWPSALEQYEDTYRLALTYRLGDIFRDVGKAYLHNGQFEKAKEFLQFFSREAELGSRREILACDNFPEALFSGDEEMRSQLNSVLEQARANPRFFKKENLGVELIARAFCCARQPVPDIGLLNLGSV